MVAASVGLVGGHWLGLAFLRGRYERTYGRAVPDARIPLMTGGIMAAAATVYTARYLGVI